MLALYFSFRRNKLFMTMTERSSVGREGQLVEQEGANESATPRPRT